MARDMTTEKERILKAAARPGEPRYPDVPPVDQRANEAFLDSLVDTDGRPMREAKPVIEREGMDDDEDDAAR